MVTNVWSSWEMEQKEAAEEGNGIIWSTFQMSVVWWDPYGWDATVNVAIHTHTVNSSLGRELAKITAHCETSEQHAGTLFSSTRLHIFILKCTASVSVSSIVVTAAQTSASLRNWAFVTRHNRDRTMSCRWPEWRLKCVSKAAMRSREFQSPKMFPQFESQHILSMCCIRNHKLLFH